MPLGYNHKGSVLLIVVFLLFFLALFVIGISNLALTDHQIAQNNKFSLQALYVAEAGIEKAVFELRRNNSWSAGFNQVQFPIGENSYYTVTVDNTRSPIVILDSLGTVQDTFQRRIVARVRVLPLAFPYPVILNSWEERTP